MTNYTKNSFTHLKKEEILKECLEGIKSFEEGEPKNFLIVHAYGDSEEIISEFISTLDGVIDEFITTLNKNEWEDDSYYLSIEGNWRDEEDEEDEEIGRLWTIHAEELNEMEEE